MKVRLVFKTPDVVYNATEGMEEEERERARGALEKWVRWGEYLTVEFDIDTGGVEAMRA